MKNHQLRFRERRCVADQVGVCEAAGRRAVSLKDKRDPGFQQLEIHLAECIIGKALTEWVKVETLATGKGLGRGR